MSGPDPDGPGLAGEVGCVRRQALVWSRRIEQEDFLKKKRNSAQFGEFSSSSSSLLSTIRQVQLGRSGLYSNHLWHLHTYPREPLPAGVWGHRAQIRRTREIAHLGGPPGTHLTHQGE